MLLIAICVMLSTQCLGASRQPLPRTGSRHDAEVSSDTTPLPEAIAPTRTSRFDEILKDFDKPGSTFKYSFEQRRKDEPPRRDQSEVREENIGRNMHSRRSTTTTTYSPRVQVKAELPRGHEVSLRRMPIIVVDDEELNKDQIEPASPAPQLIQLNNNQLHNFPQHTWNEFGNQPRYEYFIPPVSQIPEWANLNGLLREGRSDTRYQRQRNRSHYSSSTSEAPEEDIVQEKSNNQRQRVPQRSRTQVSRVPVTTQSPTIKNDYQNRNMNAPQLNRGRHRYNAGTVMLAKEPLSTSSVRSFF